MGYGLTPPSSWQCLACRYAECRNHLSRLIKYDLYIGLFYARMMPVWSQCGADILQSRASSCVCVYIYMLMIFFVLTCIGRGAPNGFS